MKLQIVSDIHVEFQSDGGTQWAKFLPDGGADALVIAGDFGNVPRCLDALGILTSRFKHIIYVLGNHEYWGVSIPEVHRMMREFDSRHTNFSWLHNKTVEVAGKKVHGTTMWFRRTMNTLRFEKSATDFKQIMCDPSEIYAENGNAVRFLEGEVGEGDIVVTHHLPSQHCVSWKFRGSPVNDLFVNPMDELMKTRRPALWIHGHTHDSKDLVNHNTRIVCNPYGLEDYEINRYYDSCMLVEVE